MGAVLTTREIYRHQVPTKRDFEITIEECSQLLREHSAISGAILCGSVVRGDYNPHRSDMDVFVLYNCKREEEALILLQEASRTAWQRKVRLSFAPCDTLLAKTHLHHVGGSYQAHLQRSADAGGLLKGNPLSKIADMRTWQEEIESYLRFKMYKLQERATTLPTLSEESRANYLQKLLEAPVHVARKVLAHENRLQGDSKKEIHEIYARSHKRLAKTLTRLIVLDEEYSTELESHLESPHASQYLELLRYIESYGQTVLDFVRANMMYIARHTAP